MWSKRSVPRASDASTAFATSPLARSADGPPHPAAIKHVANLAAAQKDKSFDYGGRTTEPEGKFIAGDCGMIQNSSVPLVA